MRRRILAIAAAFVLTAGLAGVTVDIVANSIQTAPSPQPSDPALLIDADGESEPTTGGERPPAQFGPFQSSADSGASP